MFIKLHYLFVFSLLFSYASHARDLVKNVPSCKSNPIIVKTIIPKLNGFICIEKKLSDQKLYFLNTTKKEKHLLVQAVKFTDEYYEVVNLHRYKNTSFFRAKKDEIGAFAIRFVYPEKSSVIIYWNPKSKAFVEFWETD